MTGVELSHVQSHGSQLISTTAIMKTFAACKFSRNNLRFVIRNSGNIPQHLTDCANWIQFAPRTDLLLKFQQRDWKSILLYDVHKRSSSPSPSSMDYDRKQMMIYRRVFYDTGNKCAHIIEENKYNDVNARDPDVHINENTRLHPNGTKPTTKSPPPQITGTDRAGGSGDSGESND